MGDCQQSDLRVGFDRTLKLKFLGSQVTTDAGLLAYRELDEALGLTAMGAEVLTDSRQGSNKQHQLVPLLLQSIFSRLAGYEDVVTVHTVASRDGAVSLRSLACTAWVSQSNTLRSCRRQVSITVNSRSTNRLPAADCVPNDSFRQITA